MTKLLVLLLCAAGAGPAAAERKPKATKPKVTLEQPRPPAWYEATVAGIQRRQAVHTLAGFTEALESGQSARPAELPPEVRSLYQKLQRSRVRINDVELPDRQTIEIAGPGIGTKGGKRPKLSRPKLSTLALVREALPADKAPTPEAPSDDETIIEKATALGNDPVRIYNFVHEAIATEIYAGSKKGAIGTLREGAGNDWDQASLLIALLRAAGFGARYEVSAVGLTDDQATTLAGTNTIQAAAALLATAGVPITFSQAGGPGLKVEHAWVRAYVPVTAYRGVARPGASLGWVNLAPALKTTTRPTPVDLRDAVPFNFDGYLAAPTNTRPSDAYFQSLRSYIKSHDIKCDTLDSAQPNRPLVLTNNTILPSELPARRVSRLELDDEWHGIETVVTEVPAERRHTVTFKGLSSQGAVQIQYSARLASLWGKSVTLIYEPATAADAATIASFGGLEQTPAYLIKLRAVLKLDGEPVSSGQGEAPGLIQTLAISATSPGTGDVSVEHLVTVGGVYAFVLDPGSVPADLVGERNKNLPELTGDDRAAEQLHISGLTYFLELGRARRQIAGLHWHRIFKDVEETMVALDVKVNDLRGTPVSITRQYFMLDAALIRSGNVSIDGDDHRRFEVAKLVGFESSFLEHLAGELFYGPRQFSAVKLLQLAAGDGAQVVTFTSTNVDEVLAEQVHWPAEFEERMRDAALRGMRVQAPVSGHAEAGLGTLFGFIAVEPTLGAGEYIVAFQTGDTNGLANGGVGEAGSVEGDGGSGCLTCGGDGPASSLVHLLSGNYVHQETDLTLPARGLPLGFTRTYSAQLGWHHNYDQHIVVPAGDVLTFIDDTGVPRQFTRGAGSVWLPPPTLFQVIESEAGGFKMTFKDGVVYRFDAAGKLQSQADLNGHQVTLTYRADGKLQTISGAGGGSFTLGYDGAGLLNHVSDSAGRSVSFVNQGGDLVEETNVLGKTRHYTYEPAGAGHPNRMITKTDFRQNVFRIAYDDLSRVVRIDDPEGGVRTYAYDLRHRRTIHTDRNGNATMYELNDDAQPTRIVDPLGNETVMEYDPHGSKKREVDARGNETVMTYDGQGNMLTRKEPLNAEVVYTYGTFSRLETVSDLAGVTINAYDTQGNLQSTTDAANKTTSYVYQDGLLSQIIRPGNAISGITYKLDGSLETMTDAEQGVTTFGYSPAGHLTSIIDPNSKTRTMTVDDAGQVREMFDALQRKTSFEYDDDGHRTKVVDHLMHTTRTTYDRLGRLASTTDSLENTAGREYDPEGRVVARIDARGSRTEMRYDAIGRLIAMVDPLGHETQMSYCAELAMKPCQVVDPLGNVTRVTEDDLGRETEREDPLGNVTATHYDPLGRRDQVIDPAGKLTAFGYDSVGRLKTVTDALQGVITYGYDGRGNRELAKDANQHSTTFVYDKANRLETESTPITTTNRFGYDSAGNRTTKLDGKGQLTTFVYDDNRRLTDIHYQGGTSAHFEYDVLGNRTVEENVDTRRTMTYDALNRLETVTDVPTGRTITYTYDAAGNRASMTVVPENETTSYAWDARGLLARMTDPQGGVYQFSYDAAGRRTRTLYPNGMALTTTYDAASRVVSMVYRKGSGDVIESFSYTYDKRGNRLSKTFANGTSEVYGYDDLARLVSATYPSGRSVTYKYDAAGNRIEMVEGTTSGSSPTCPNDQDCDGVIDLNDNCPTIANSNQQDSDAPAYPAGLVAGYPMDEATGTFAIKDVTGRNDGSMNYGPGHVPGQHGNALEVQTVDGGQRVKVPTSPSLQSLGSQLTLAAWVKPAPSPQTSGAILSKQSSFALFVGSDTPTTYRIQLSTPSAGIFNSTGVIPQNQWSHVAVTVGGGRVKFYLNGQLSGDFAQSVTPFFGTPGFLFMMCHNHVGNECSAFPLVGTVDDVGIWNRPLSQSEIQTVMTTAVPIQDRLGDVCDACVNNPDRNCTPTTCLDKDGDGYGVPGASACAAGQPAVFDCDDANPNVHRGAVEQCDGIDNNCDGRVDESCLQSPQVTVYSYNASNQLLSAGPPRICPANDVDCDGVLDAQDNCPFIANPDQANSDANQPNANGLGARALWGFGEGTGTTTADSSGTFNGTLVGTPNWVTGFSGEALDFHGASGTYVSNTVMTGPAAPYTIEAKVKLTSRSGILMRWGNLGPLWQMSGTGTQVALQNPVGTVPTGQWVHLAFSYDGTTSRYYVDGVLAGAVNQAPWSSGETPLKIGDGLSGAMDEVAVWSRVLTASEVQAHTQSLFGDKLGDACDPCKNNSDPSCAPTTCQDADGDGYGVQGASACPGGVDKFDCNDANGDVHPGVRDVCDGVDNDCDGLIDEDCPQSGTTFQYDLNGNQVHQVVGGAADTQFIFDARDRLVEVRNDGVSVATYGYDTQNLRTSLTDSAGDRRVLLDGLDEAGEYETGTTFRVRRYDHDPNGVDRLLGQVSGGATYAVSDALGSVYATVDAGAAVEARYSYDAFGAREAMSEMVPTPWGFTGRRVDTESRMYYRERYYAPQTGSFMSRDPLAMALPTYMPGPNDGIEIIAQMQAGYAYVLSSPTNRADPTGYIFGIGPDETVILDLAEQGVLYPLTVYFEQSVARTMGWECASCKAAFSEGIIYSEKVIGRRIPLAMSGWDPRNGKYFPNADYGHRIALSWDLALLELAGLTMVKNCYLFEHRTLGIWYVMIGGIDASRYLGGGSLGRMN